MCSVARVTPLINQESVVSVSSLPPVMIDGLFVLRFRWRKKKRARMSCARRQMLFSGGLLDEPANGSDSSAGDAEEHHRRATIGCRDVGRWELSVAFFRRRNQNLQLARIVREQEHWAAHD